MRYKWAKVTITIFLVSFVTNAIGMILELEILRRIGVMLFLWASFSAMTHFLVYKVIRKHAYISNYDNYVQGAQISVERRDHDVDTEEDDKPAFEISSDECVLDNSNERNLCVSCLSKNVCSVLQDLRKRGISLEIAHISECNQFLEVKIGELVRCKYCGTLQDEPRGAKICVQCGGSM